MVSRRTSSRSWGSRFWASSMIKMTFSFMGMTVQQKALEDVQSLPFVSPQTLQPEVLADIVEEIGGTQFGIKQIGRSRFSIQLAQKGLNEDGFPGADLPGDDREPFPLLHCIDQVGQPSR